MDEHTKANLEMWNRLVPINARSKLYDVEGFKRGRSSLSNIEIRELRPLVKGKSVLHLQCHFGMDTLSLARLGAKKVTGLDFSPDAISLARELAIDVRLDHRSEFVCSDIYDLPPSLAKSKFDVVFTGGGALFWLKDLHRWGRIVARFLRRGGVFYLMEFHPFSNMFDEGAPTPRFRYPYFHSTKPTINKEEHTWAFGMGDLMSSLINAGLRIEYLREFTSVGYKRFPFLVRRRDGRWHWKDSRNAVPLVFSLKASKV